MINFKNIIFDLGGVILDIDYKRTIKAFSDLGITNAKQLYSKSSQIGLFDQLEKGNISEQDFYSGIRNLSNQNLSDNEIRNAWNAILIGLPEENIELISRLQKNHRLFLLSNTNIIHENAYRKMIIGQYGSFILEELFEKMYLSHYLHMRKPDEEIFRFVLNDSDLLENETCFIDDSSQHVNGARKLNINAFLLENQNLVSFMMQKNLV